MSSLSVALDGPNQPSVLIRKTVVCLDSGFVGISNVLSGDRRLALYWVYPGVCGTGSIHMLAINAKTGEPLGSPTLVEKLGDFALAALDPYARFYVFALYDSLFFQALDATGHKSGSARLLAKDGYIYGAPDIMQE